MTNTTHPTVLVTGGTGTLGRLVVGRLRDAGHGVRVLSRRPQEAAVGIEYVTGDLATGTDIGGAVVGAEVVLHLAGSAKGDDHKARHLVDASRRAGVRHLVNISVVGADRIPVVSKIDRAMFGYFASKLAAERIIADSGIPWTTLRATQFHELTFETVRQMSKLPVVPVPRFRFQPIAADEVAARLVELTLGAPAGLVPDLGGPQVHEMRELVRSYLRETGKHRLTPPVQPPGSAAAAFRDGANLTPDRAVGSQSWSEFLGQRLGSLAATATLV